ncbi:MAG: VWA domain-containing protein [Gammaproteobacteria bacterium]|nr:VWA domain-containing protein [Gammaproteobacteria bacterium]MXW46376.1 VWA domain-containing protein [Gammaproteobacteria bacterium]MYD01239.1 VWA domain-containing protein [Gammaproteobacteria bacterium]MYI26375.1 VWA domain-containing protein [Gammaproteobacteria bacterium]
MAETINGGGLAGRVVDFVRTLRSAGVPLGVGRSALALKAVERIDVGDRAGFANALRCVLTASPAEGVLFDCAFPMFFGNSQAFARLGDLRAQGLRFLGENKPPPGALRLLRAKESSAQLIAAPGAQRAVAGAGYSPQESLSAKDFGQMSPEEQAQAQELLRRGVFCPTRLGRRFRPAAHGPRIDIQATLRAGLASGGELVQLKRKTRRPEPLALVLLFDVSGSMTSYARMALHFAHTLCSTRRNVEVFVFATRLTRVTRELRARDGDVATAAALKAAPDWEGGTRIASALSEFNRLWSRRVLARPGVVLLLSDGLERARVEKLRFEAGRLRRSCKRLMWLNPLLGYEGFEPRARGVRALLPAVHEHRSAHNVSSLLGLADALD